MSGTHARDLPALLSRGSAPSLLDQTVPGCSFVASVSDAVWRQAHLCHGIVLLREEYFTSSQIAVALGVTERHVRDVMIELGLHRPRRYLSASHGIECLPRWKREWLEKFRNGTARPR